MRRCAAEQAEALTRQKQLAGQQQAEFAGEVKRMQSLLEAMNGQVRGNPSVPGGNSKQPDDESSVMGRYWPSSKRCTATSSRGKRKKATSQIVLARRVRFLRVK